MLGLYLQVLHQEHCHPPALTEAVLVLREALEPCSANHPRKFDLLTRHGAVLQDRFEAAQDASDLDDALMHYRDAVRQGSSEGHACGVVLVSTGAALATRFEEKGHPSDLEDGIGSVQEAMKDLDQKDKGLRSRALHTLGVGLIIRYKREGSVSDLNTTISTYREALELKPIGHPKRDLTASQLSECLSWRYHLEGSKNDLTEAINLAREALKLRPAGRKADITPCTRLASFSMVSERRPSRPS